jgi:hypothetical protein
MEHGPSAPFIHIPTYTGEKGKGFTMLPMKSIPRIIYFFLMDENHFRKKKKIYLRKKKSLEFKIFDLKKKS